MEVEPGGDGLGLFFEQADGEEDAAELVAEEFGPVLLDELKLAFEGVGRGEHGGFEGGEQALCFGAYGGAGLEVAVEAGGDAGVDGGTREGLVVEELFEGLEGGVDIGEPEEQELFHGCFAVGDGVGGGVEPLVDGELAPVDGDVGEAVGEGGDELVELEAAGVGGEPGERLGEDFGIDGAPVVGEERVTELIDEAHSEERGGVDEAGCIGVASFVHPGGEAAAGGGIDKDGVAIEFKQGIADVIALPDSTRDVKFHNHGHPNTVALLS